jgi:acetyl-CoA carboxylase carboxyl transferase subunit beta
MSILDWLAANKEKEKKTTEKLNIPGDLWVKCFECGDILYLKELTANYKVCTKCGYHFRITAEERINYLVDEDSFKEIETKIAPQDFLNFQDTESYIDRIKKSQKKTKRKDAIIIGEATLHNIKINLGVMDFSFMGGSMGSVVGEKITRIMEHAIKNKNPLIIVTASGGARMQEGIMSLMQMAKTSAAVAKLEDAKVPYICILTDPTTGGTTASFAMLGDINLAEPGALISFAGPRVIEQTIKQKLPKGFQRAEFLLEHGFVDSIVPRKNLRDILRDLLISLYSERKEK